MALSTLVLTQSQPVWMSARGVASVSKTTARRLPKTGSPLKTLGNVDEIVGKPPADGGPTVTVDAK
jgi:hypothetical protein